MTLTGRAALVLSALAIVTAMTVGHATAAEIAVVKSADLKKYNEVLTGFSVVSKIPVVEYDMKKDADRGKKIFEVIRSKKPALVLAIGPAAANMARKELTDIPVVFVMVPNIEKYNLAADHITGISLQFPLKVQLATLKTFLPRMRSVGVLYNPKYSKDLFEKARAAATEMGLNLVPSMVDDPDEVPSAIGTFAGKVDAVWMISDPTVSTPSAVTAIIKWTGENRVPFFSTGKKSVKRGALASLSPDYAAIGQQAGRLANQIVTQKLPPKTIPVAEPEGLSIAMNLTTARRLGVECNMALEIFTFAATQGYPIKVYK